MFYRVTGLISNAASAQIVQRNINEFATRYTVSCDPDDATTPISVEAMTGVLFVINNAAIELIVECEAHTLIAFVNHCNVQLVQAGIASFKVLTFVECVPRSFSLFVTRSLRHNQSEEWHTTNVPMNVTSLPLPPHMPSPLLTVAFSTLHAMLALAGYVKSLPVDERMEFLSSSLSRHLIDRVCPVDRIQGFAASDELMTFPEFLEAYDAPLQIQNPRDHVWPIEQHTSSLV